MSSTDLVFADRHAHRAWLAGQARLPAINLYLRFGFRPQLETPGERRAWETLREALPALHPHLI
jgi:hypothetical protein